MSDAALLAFAVTELLRCSGILVIPIFCFKDLCVPLQAEIFHRVPKHVQCQPTEAPAEFNTPPQALQWCMSFANAVLAPRSVDVLAALQAARARFTLEDACGGSMSSKVHLENPKRKEDKRRAPPTERARTFETLCVGRVTVSRLERF